MITIWQRHIKHTNDEGDEWYEWEHNHISQGYDPDLKSPVSNFKKQAKLWKGEL